MIGIIVRSHPGHVFVVKADVTALECDAWLCPTDDAFHVTAGFGRPVDKPEGGFLAGYQWMPDELVKVFGQPDKRPLIVLGRIGRTPAMNPEEVSEFIDVLLPVIDKFVELAIQHCEEPEGRPLRIALPLIGTGEGGLRGAKGDVVRPLLAHLAKITSGHRIDLILCTVNALAWSAVQSARQDDDWRLTSEEKQLAADLAAEAQAGRLVFFIGAGVSRDAGLPNWQDLLTALHGEDISEEEESSLNNLDPRDHAMLIELAVGGRAHLLARLAREIGRYERFGLTHSLLASIGAEQAVTTNYDSLYERACTRPGHVLDDDLTVLPYGRVVESRPWLLKLHGSLDQLDREDHIVLTRPDYMRLARERSALFGIVQALLVTKHLLFVGYSLGDEDFHQLVDEIRIAIGSSDSEHVLGTVLTTSEWSLARLWDDLLRVDQIGRTTDLPNRHLQIFLDRVAHLATPHESYLLDESFAGLLDSAEARISSSLEEVQNVVEEVLKKYPGHKTAKTVHRALEQFGAAAAPREGRAE